jgi:hypothetical protein
MKIISLRTFFNSGRVKRLKVANFICKEIWYNIDALFLQKIRNKTRPIRECVIVINIIP